MKFLLSCEHGGYEIPAEYQLHFEDAGNVLNSHRGYDPGAMDLFLFLQELADYSFSSKTSRLLIELNRSLHHPKLFSEFTNDLSFTEKERLIEDFYSPYRNSIEALISEILRNGDSVLHISVHSFTPELHGKVRNTDIGLLFDPSRPEEKNYCKMLKDQIQKFGQQFKVRFNYPYLGKADGFTSYLRKKFPKNYIGIELEINQKFTVNNQMDALLKNRIARVLKISLK